MDTSSRPTKRIALLCFSMLAFAGCDGTQFGDVTFGSLDAGTQAKYSSAIAGVFEKTKAWPVTYTVADLAKHPRDAAVLTRLGYVTAKGGTFRFTFAGRRASSYNCDSARGECATFIVGRPTFVSIGTIRLRKAEGIGSGAGAVLVKVRLRTSATTELGKALAGASDLVCETNRAAAPWNGADTEADGAVILPLTKTIYNANVASVADAVATVPGPFGLGGPQLYNTCPGFNGAVLPVYAEYGL